MARSVFPILVYNMNMNLTMGCEMAFEKDHWPKFMIGDVSS
jgi:uncharacterized protein YcbX